jgi:hypothetical protein
MGLDMSALKTETLSQDGIMVNYRCNGGVSAPLRHFRFLY